IDYCLISFSLHSFIISDLDMIAGLFDDADDEQAVTKVLQVLTEDSIRSLSKGEKQLISLYNKPPNELEEMLYIGCSNIVVEAKSDITSTARQKNRERESVQWKQQVGRKVDGLVSCISPPFEMLVVEAANVDNGPQGTKAMTDTLKLSKTMKDMFDSILE
ncbi:hypothetical protein BGW38_005939, partial [Lunasporangiospora selenospora]